jgi:hypothetical protein
VQCTTKWNDKLALETILESVYYKEQNKPLKEQIGVFRFFEHHLNHQMKCYSSTSDNKNTFTPKEQNKPFHEQIGAL